MYILSTAVGSCTRHGADRLPFTTRLADTRGNWGTMAPLIVLVTATLVGRDYKREEILKILGSNFLRVLRANQRR